MKTALALVLSLAVAPFAMAEDKMADKSSMDPKHAEMAKAFEEASTPGAEHDMLKSLVGKWKVNTKAWQSESAKPEESTGTSTFKTILGGRFVQQEFKGKMMGKPYEGSGTMGFNNVSKKFESTWQDSMSTQTMLMEGQMDASTKVIAQTGEFECPIKKKTEKMRSEFKIIDKNNATFTMYMPDMVTGKEIKGMEQVYKRM